MRSPRMTIARRTANTGVMLLSRAFLRKEDVGPQLIVGVAGAVCGVVLLLVT